MRDVMDQLEALYSRLIAVEADLHAATQVIGRVSFRRAGVDRREIDRLDHYLHTAHEAAEAMLDEFKATLRAAMKNGKP